MSSLSIISTESVPRSERISLYQQTLWDYFGRLESKVVGDRPFRACFEYARLGDVGVCKLRASGHRVERTSALAKLSDGCLKIVLQIEGTGYFEQNGRRLHLLPNQWSVYDTAKSYTVIVPDEAEFLLLMFPREKVASKRYDMDELTVRPFSGSVGIGRLVWQFIRSAFEEIPNLDQRSHSDIVDTIANLVRSSMVEFSGKPVAGSRRLVIQDSSRSYIRSHLRDPELGIEQLASTLNCSRRYLHKVFELEGISISDYIRQSRLDHCRADLLDPNLQDMSITNIAFSWGFNSSAYFSTAFKEYFGATPSCYRRERGAQTPAPAPSRAGRKGQFSAPTKKRKVRTPTRTAERPCGGASN